MNTETGLTAVSLGEHSEHRQRGDDRRESRDRRRGQFGRRGLFEFRAHREGVSRDRRQRERRDGTGGRSWWGFWRRDS